jgi:C4-type Zn-finger protein
MIVLWAHGEETGLGVIVLFTECKRCGLKQANIFIKEIVRHRNVKKIVILEVKDLGIIFSFSSKLLIFVFAHS